MKLCNAAYRAKARCAYGLSRKAADLNIGANYKIFYGRATKWRGLKKFIPRELSSRGQNFLLININVGSMSVNLFNKPYWIVGLASGPMLKVVFVLTPTPVKLVFPFASGELILTLEFYMILNPFLIVDKLL